MNSLSYVVGGCCYGVALSGFLFEAVPAFFFDVAKEFV